MIPLIAASIKEDKTDEEKTAMACAGMIGIGVGEIMGSFANGYLHDKLGSKKFVLI